MNRTRPAAVLFDWDNTLVDSWAVLHACVNQTMAAMGHDPWDLETVRRNVRASLRDSFPKLFGERWEEARAEYYRAFEAVHLERLTPLPGALELVRDLHAAGTYIAVVSNKTGRFLRQEADQLGWSQWFGCVLGAADAEKDKPDPAPALLALARGGVDPARQTVWFVGDTDVDLRCAHAAGCVAVLVGAPEAGEDLSECAPHHHFDDLFALRAALGLAA